MYATVQDLELALGADILLRIADRDRDGIADAPLIEDSLLRASSEIDSAIGGRYRLPLARIPAILRSVAIDLAHFHLDHDPTDSLVSRAKTARATLAALSAGKMTLDDAQLITDGAAPDERGSTENLPQVRQATTRLDMDGY